MKDNFNIFLPADMDTLTKSIDSNEKGNYVRGWASTPDMDKQGDMIDPTGIDISEFMQRGWINYEHMSDKRIGVPTENCYVDPARGLFVEAKLLMDRPEAITMWDKATAIAKSGSGRPLGFSIEGIVESRDALDPSIIRSVKITDIALTEKPANINATWEMLVKSMMTGSEFNPESMEGASALRIQSLSDTIYNLTYQLKGLSLQDIRLIAKSLDSAERYDDDVATLLLQVGYGLSQVDASNRISKLDFNEED